jgi:hypothetical protein
MPLERMQTEILREEGGFAFSMRVSGTRQHIRVFVSDEALEGDAPSPEAEDLRVQLESDRQALEAIAGEKFRRGQVTSDGVVAITLSDIVSFLE